MLADLFLTEELPLNSEVLSQNTPNPIINLSIKKQIFLTFRFSDKLFFKDRAKVLTI